MKGDFCDGSRMRAVSSGNITSWKDVAAGEGFLNFIDRAKSQKAL
jgi:hypothetical protein